jgi:hypothetical protein
LVRQGNSWSLDPFSEFRKEDHAIFERGRGNVCSVEVRMDVFPNVLVLKPLCSSTVCIAGMRLLPRRTSNGSRN